MAHGSIIVSANHLNYDFPQASSTDSETDNTSLANLQKKAEVSKRLKKRRIKKATAEYQEDSEDSHKDSVKPVKRSKKVILTSCMFSIRLRVLF